MARYRDELACPGVLVDRVRRPLTNEDGPSDDHLPDEVATFHAAERGRGRPAAGRANCTYASIRSLMASRRFRYASACVRPWLYAPGNEGMEAVHHLPLRW